MYRGAFGTPEGLILVLMIYAVFLFGNHPFRNKRSPEMICAGLGVALGIAYFLWKIHGLFVVSSLFFVTSMLILPVHDDLRGRKNGKG
ncbi:MAG: hypothetical protein IJ662_06645 [Clostridia bacterium]|nr:hypothetical protein [Clostridia bacterium]